MSENTNENIEKAQENEIKAPENEVIIPEGDVKATENEVNTPEEEKKAVAVKKFPYFEPFAGIFIAIVCTVVFLWFTDLITIAFYVEPPILIPAFLRIEIQALWLPIILWGLVRIAGNIAYLIEKVYTQRLAIISLVANALTVIITSVILARNYIVNPEYADYMIRLFEPSVAPWFGVMLANPHIIIIVIVSLVMVLDSITVVRKRNKVIEAEASETV